MAAVMYRHTSTVSLVSQSSVQLEAGLLVQCLNRYRENLEFGCERVLEALYSKTGCRNPTSLNYCAVSSGKNSPNPIASTSPSRASSQNNNITSCTSSRRLDPRARESLGQHLIELLATLVLPEPPQSIGEVDTRLSDGLPSIPDKLMPSESDSERYRNIAEKGRKKGLRLPVEKIYLAFKEFSGRFSHTVCIYIVAVAEHIIGNFLQVAICYEEKALTENLIRASTIETLFILYRDRFRSRRKTFEHRLANRFPQDYDKCVDELDNFLHSSLEQMNLLLRVFREPVLAVSQLEQTKEDNAHLIFGSILDLYNNMRIFLDTVDADEEDSYVTGVGKTSFTSTTNGVATETANTSTDSSTVLDTGSEPNSTCDAAVSSLNSSPKLVAYTDSDNYVKPTEVVSSQQSPIHIDTFRASIPQPVRAPNGFQRHRLVGVCLLELAEDDSLHAFSQYATTVLNSISRDRAWALCETENFVAALCRLSRTILHTASWNKIPGSPTRTCLSSALDLRLTDVHSVTCSRCRFWDSVMSTPRRRSTSSNAVRLTNEANSCPSPSAFLSVKNPGHRTHRSSHSSSMCHMPAGAPECNFLVNAFKYLLPRLLLLPIFQFFYLHELIETLHRSAYDDEESARLSEVLSMLGKTRVNLERDLSKQSWVCLHLARLISTGHLISRYLPLYLDLLAGSTCPPSPISGSGSNHITPPSPSVDSNGATGNAFSSAGYSYVTQTSSSCAQFCSSTTGSVNSGFTGTPGDVSGYAQPGKAEEIERLLGGKDKLLAPGSSRLELGDFVMEGRLHLRTETKRSSTEHIAYLFTGLLVICKWQERCTTLNPNTSQPSVLRVKQRIPLDSIHVTDMAPIVQPNLPLYVGNTGTVTSSAVGAAVLAASSASACGVSMHLDDYVSFSSSGLNGSVVGHAGLMNVASGTSCALYPYSLELEFVDIAQIASISPSQGSTHRLSSGPHTRHTSPLQKHQCPLTLPSNELSHGDPTSSGMVNNSSTGFGCTDPNCPSALTVHHVWLSFRTQEEKADWMASLLSIQLHRLFLRYIRTLPKIEIPLRIPSPASYRFSQPDSPDNIVFETDMSPTRTAHGSEIRGSLDSSENDLDEDNCIPLESEDYDPEPPTATGNVDLYDASNFHSSINPEVHSGPNTEVPNRARSPTESCAAANISENDSATLTADTNSEMLRSLSGRHFPAQLPPRTIPACYPPQIRMATLEKVIERMTYPSYFDTNLVNTFLLVYRRIITPEVFLDLLIDRFRIPDPEFLPAELKLDAERGQLESPAQHMLKRFRSGYKKRVQARVIMVLSRWVRSSRYYQNDFVPRPDLCRRLSEFLATVQARHLQSAVRRIVQHLQNPPISTADIEVDTVNEADIGDDSGIPRPTNFDLSCPTTVSVRRAESFTDGSQLHSKTKRDGTTQLTLTTIHPYKLAEQVTLYEWELYRRIRFWEVDGRDRTDHPTPNLDRSKAFSNQFRNWLVYAILSEPHPDDRVVSIQRVIDLMLIMEHMNNLQGSQEAKSALISAAVFRLRKSFQTIRKLRHYRQVVDRIRREATVGPKPQSIGISTNTNPSLFGPGLPFATKASRAHERRIKDLEKRQASGDASNPCVPFIAAGVMTRLIHLDLRHSDTVRTESGVEMINCWKHRQLAEAVERYLAFQRVPYQFEVDPEIRLLLEHLDPLGQAEVTSELEFERRMYQLSELYEPRESDPVGESTVNCTPAVGLERRMSKEAIQAATLLSTVPLKERMSLQSMFNFSAALNLSSGSYSSRLFSPAYAAGPGGSRPSRKGPVKSPQSVSPPPHSNVSRSQDRGISGIMQQNRQLGIPPTRTSTELVCRSVDTAAQSTNSAAGSMIISSTASHQHSMSDSQVFAINRHISPHHQTTHSFGTSGVSTALSAIAGSETRGILNTSTPPTTPGLPTDTSSTTMCDPLPPPLPPRRSGQNSSGSSSAKFQKSPSPLPLLITPSVFSSPRISSPHHQNLSQNENSTGNTTTPPWFMSDIMIVENPNYLPQTASTPPPLPPKSSSNCSRTSMHATGGGSVSSSPHHHMLHAPSLGQQFLFDPDGSGCGRKMPPPLPPRQQTASTSPTVSRVTPRPVSAPQNNGDSNVVQKLGH